MKKILLSTPTMHGEEMAFIQEAFDTNWVAPLGANVDAFERELANFVGAKSAAACVSGTSALFLAYKLAGVKPGDVVLCSDMTFAATVNPITYLGGVPVFVDSEYETWNMSPEALEEGFRKYPQCKVVGLAHLYGTPAKMDEILEICRRHDAILVEDAAEALSATYHGKQCGTFGALSVFSFNGNKIITTSGGGMLMSDDSDAIKRAVYLSTQARQPVPWYQHEEIGYNFRMSNIVAGIGRGQLRHLEEHRLLKKQVYERYAEGLRGLPLEMNPYLPDTEPNFWLSCILLHRDAGITPMEMMERLNTAAIESRPIWKPMHMQPVYAQNDFISTGAGEDIFARGLCLPSDIKMTAEEQEYVIQQLRLCFA